MVRGYRKKALSYLYGLKEEVSKQVRAGLVGVIPVPCFFLDASTEAFRGIGLITKGEWEAYKGYAKQAMASFTLKFNPDHKVSIKYGFIVLCGPCQFGEHLADFPEKCWVGRNEGEDRVVVFLNKKAAYEYASNRLGATRACDPLSTYPCFYVESAQRLHSWPSWIPEGGAVLADAVLRLEQEIAP